MIALRLPGLGWAQTAGRVGVRYASSPSRSPIRPRPASERLRGARRRSVSTGGSVTSAWYRAVSGHLTLMPGRPSGGAA